MSSRNHEKEQPKKYSGLAKSRGIRWLGAVALLFVLVWITLTGYRVSWTGFGDFNMPSSNYVRAKTFWDWMELLIIPLILAAGAFLLNRSERDSERKQEEKRAILDHEISTDQHRESALQAYLDRMADLLVREKLATPESSQEVRHMAATRTLALLRELDATRKGLVLRFLIEAGLAKQKYFFELIAAELQGASLQGAHLEQALLQGANLQGANLSEAMLNNIEMQNANLQSVNLQGAYLQRANLRGALLQGAELQGAFLRFANLSRTNLEKANLQKANLEDANMVDAILVSAQLNGSILKRANLCYANLLTANLQEADLEHANMRNTNLRSANLGKADLRNADLRGADLQGANLLSAKLSGADLSYANLKTANLADVNLLEAKLENIFLEREQWTFIRESLRATTRTRAK